MSSTGEPLHHTAAGPEPMVVDTTGTETTAMRLLTKGGIVLASGALVVSLAACAQPASTSGSSSAPSGSTSSSTPADTTPTPLADVPNLTGVHTQVTLDKGFLDALTSLKLTPGVVGSAELSKDGVLTFPITGGNVKYFDPTKPYRPYVQGEIDHDGSGISLTAGDKKVELENFVIDPGNNSHLSGDVSLNGKSVVKGATLFTLDGSTLKPLSMDSDGNAVLEGTRVLVSPDAAKLLNDTFGTDAVTDTLLVGVAKITAKVS